MADRPPPRQESWADRLVDDAENVGSGMATAGRFQARMQMYGAYVIAVICVIIAIAIAYFWLTGQNFAGQYWWGWSLGLIAFGGLFAYGGWYNNMMAKTSSGVAGAEALGTAFDAL